MARLKDTYVNEVAPALMKKFGYKSVMQIPKIEKVVVKGGVLAHYHLKEYLRKIVVPLSLSSRKYAADVLKAKL